MDKLKKTKKITLATLKAFAKRNADKLYSMSESDFSGMSDCVETNKEAKFEATELKEEGGYYSTGIQGVYTVGRSNDYFSIYEDETYFGIRVYNCCGSSVLAIKK